MQFIDTQHDQWRTVGGEDGPMAHPPIKANSLLTLAQWHAVRDQWPARNAADHKPVGVILSNDADIAKKINSAVFPGQQGGPLEHVIAAKAVAFKHAASPEFADRQRRTLEGSRIRADRLSQPDVAAAGVKVLTGGTDVHLVLVDLVSSELDGKQAEDVLHQIGITVNRNAVPNDPRPPMVTSGLRIGTPALATRGFGEVDFTEVADVIAEALKPGAAIDELRARVEVLAAKHPLYSTL